MLLQPLKKHLTQPIPSLGKELVILEDYKGAIVPPSDTMRIIDTLINPMHKVLVLLVACTGLRASEAVGLRWGDIRDGLIHVLRRWSAASLDGPKTERSKAPVACHPTLLHFLNEWRKISPHASDSDWIFPSLKMHGKIPRSAGIFVTDYLRPAALKACVVMGRWSAVRSAFVE